ncbi:uncharacterized protein LOC127847851 [Dreissena polymorpha]|uniref:Ig-like domain-containing protein n=1 Tax=Dreissena polymorpha TaxID=45954 RepID=A0A9D4DEH1_DREPO|nr:uncharacterized protein LOC127847851 [Dreissena polymorpha]KAH3746990.1 hypothetical protein DPMN_181410 [Dreissena polymorpha]
MFLPILLSVTVWFAVGIPPSLQVALIKRQQGAYLPIECSLASDISFKFTNKQSNKTQTIAACSININSCYLSDRILAQRYAIAKSDVGGVLFVIDVSDDTFGTYTCYETYNASNSAVINLSVADLQNSTYSPTCQLFEECSSSFIPLLFDGVQILLLVVCIACIIFRVNCTSFFWKRHLSTGGETQLKKIEDTTGSLRDSSLNEVVQVETRTADIIRYDKEMDYRSILSAVDTLPKTIAEIPMLKQSGSVSLEKETLLRPMYTSPERALIRNPGNRNIRSLTGIPADIQGDAMRPKPNKYDW